MRDRIVDPRPQDHIVQLYDADEELLVRNIGRYLAEGIRRGEGALVVARTARQAIVLAELLRLSVDTTKASTAGLLRVMDAEETLERILIDGRPDRTRFDEVVGTVLSEMSRVAPANSLRVYGEMVGTLWLRGDVGAAMELEQLWNDQLGSRSFALFCGYPIDVFGKEFQSAVIDGILCSHSVLLPSGDARLDGSLERAIDEVAGSNTFRRDALPESSSVRADLPKAEATMLWLRSNLPRDADEILDRARLFYTG